MAVELAFILHIEHFHTFIGAYSSLVGFKPACRNKASAMADRGTRSISINFFQILNPARSFCNENTFPRSFSACEIP